MRMSLGDDAPYLHPHSRPVYFLAVFFEVFEVTLILQCLTVMIGIAKPYTSVGYDMLSSEILC